MNNKVIGFHNPSEINGYLSNWYLSDFVVDGINYSSMEQYMMYCKARVFNDSEAMDKIMKTDDVAKIKALGRTVRNYNNVVWDGMRQILIYKGLLEKFRQNDELKKMLLATGDHVLAECAVSDKIWGIGLRMGDDKQHDMENWTGRNLLGFALMCVREELRKDN